jgi:DNA-binding PadR family transcriptional regulator
VSPVFGHGQLRLYLLAALADGPRHGYLIIRGLADRFGGRYAPSAGTVYPRLARLAEEGLVTREDGVRKAVYRITPAGLAEVSARQDELTSLQVTLDRSIRSADRIERAVDALRRQLSRYQEPARDPQTTAAIIGILARAGREVSAAVRRSGLRDG